MILALDRHGALYVFASTADAEGWLEAIDVQDESIEFCDIRGQQYSPEYTRPPKVSRGLLFSSVDIGAFRLVPQGDPDHVNAERFIERAQHIEHTGIPSIGSIDAVRHELHK